MRESTILRDIMRALGTGAVRVCPKCRETKPLEAFGKSLQAYCKPCMAAYKRARYQANREHEVARSAAWSKANAGRVAETRRRQRAERPEHFRAYQRKRRRETPEKFAAFDANKRAKRRAKLAGSVGVTAEQWAEIKRKCGNRCAYCGARGTLTMDHVVPVSKGGLHEPKNILPACVRCNSRKGATDPVEYANRLGKLL